MPLPSFGGKSRVGRSAKYLCHKRHACCLRLQRDAVLSRCGGVWDDCANDDTDFLREIATAMRFTGRTSDNRLRHPTFLELRSDKQGSSQPRDAEGHKGASKQSKQRRGRHCMHLEVDNGRNVPLTAAWG